MNRAYPLVGAATFVLLLAAGCGTVEQAATPSEPGDAAVTAKTQEAAPNVEPKPPVVDWNERLNLANSLITSGDLPASTKALDELAAARKEARLSDEQARQLAALQAELAKRSAEAAARRRVELLAQADAAIKDGDLAAASRSLDGALAIDPTPAERDAAGKLRAKIETTRKARRDLESQMRLLEQVDRGSVRAARERLLVDTEVALPLLVEATRSDNPVLVANALEVLRYIPDTDRTIPAMIGVLASGKHEKSWPEAIRVLEKLDQPGAGAPLLKLALSATDARQQAAALTALANVQDPPSETLVSLLLRLQADDAALGDALRVAAKAARLHRQVDVPSRRGLDGLTEEQEKLLAALPARLEKIVAADAKSGELGETARQAMSLGIVTGILEPAVLKPLKVVRPDPETERAAQAVADGQWNSTDAAHMWLHSTEGRPLVVLDLGRERTVTGVRIWNYNLPGTLYRGWKEVELFVSPEPALLSPVARGQVPQARGEATGADYSVTLAVPAVRGRYIKIEPRSTWNPDGSGGVTEIEILGF
jgi:hypothetical protein